MSARSRAQPWWGARRTPPEPIDTTKPFLVAAGDRLLLYQASPSLLAEFSHRFVSWSQGTQQPVSGGKSVPGTS